VASLRHNKILYREILPGLYLIIIKIFSSKIIIKVYSNPKKKMINNRIAHY